MDTGFGGLLREKEVVGASGFEPETFCTPSKRATRLRYAPTGWRLLKKMVGERGFGPLTFWSRTKRATRLRYSPIEKSQ